MTDRNTHTEIVRQAVAIAKEAGVLLREFSDGEKVVEQIASNDLKLEADRLSEELIVGRIREQFPAHAVLGEEGGQAGRDEAEYRWIVDPLDGTVNYYHGLPYYCTSIACYESAGLDGPIPGLGRPVVGVVYAPPTDELFLARPGQGATCNGRAIQPGRQTSLGEVGVAVGFGKTRELGEQAVAVADRFAGHVQKLRCLGAAAYDLCNVAAGRLGGFFERSLRTWDIAAGAIVVAEAGGAFEAQSVGSEAWRTLASAPSLFDEVRHLLRGI